MAGKSRGTKFTKEQIEKAMQCKNADELLALAKAELYDMTRDEARRTWRNCPTWSWTASS